MADTERNAKHGSTDFITTFPSRLESWVQKLDRIIGGTREIERFKVRRPDSDSESPRYVHRSAMAFALPVCVFFFVLYGPAGISLEGIKLRGWLPVVLLLMAIGCQFVYFSCIGREIMPWVHWALITVLSAITLGFGGARQTDPGLYRHYYAIAAFVVMTIALSAQALRRLTRDDHWIAQGLERLRHAYDPNAVVASDPKSPGTRWDLVRALIESVLRTPLHIVAPVAFYAILSPPDLLVPGVLIGFALSWLLIAAANYDPRNDAFVRFVRNVFLSGAALALTLAVIVLAVLRLSHFSYVTTVLDAGFNSTIVSYVVSTYVLLWLYDFWIQQAEIEFLGGLDRFAAEEPKVEIWRHGGGRIALVINNVQHFFEPSTFLNRVADTATTNARELRTIASRIGNWTVFISTIATLVLCGTIAVVVVVANEQPQVPGLRLSSTPAPNAQFDLAKVLLDRAVPDKDTASGAQQATRKPAHVVMLAASGGGTRAALYTAAVLRGLQRLEELDHLVLASGVSGGSAALAYFAAFRDELKTKDEMPWHEMFDTLSKPFIDDVFVSASELRTLTGVRLGQLLTDSFERRFFTARAKRAKETIGAHDDLGLIFNTGLCGEAERTGASQRTQGGSADQAGGFVTITNLARQNARDAQGPPGWSLQMPIEELRDPSAPLLAAASLSANFPPVFPNAAIDVGSTARYWVTDGGAVENRGLITLLYELEAALRKIQSSLVHHPRPTVALPDIKIVIAEASAFDASYSSDRGLGAKFGASEKIANGLIRALLTSVNELHRAISERDGGVKAVYVPMPDALRASGTFGTHWMMPPKVAFGTGLKEDEKLKLASLEKDIVLQLLDSLFSEDFCEAYAQKQWPELPSAVLVKRLGTPLPWALLKAGFR